MNEEKNSNELLSKFQRCKIILDEDEDLSNNNVENIIYDGGWKTDNEVINNLVHSFIHYKDNFNIPTDKLDFGTYTKDFYKNKHPKFSDEICEVLAKCSKEKVRDERMKPYERIDKETTLTFS